MTIAFMSMVAAIIAERTAQAKEKASRGEYDSRHGEGNRQACAC
jgi:hypothetical protein